MSPVNNEIIKETRIVIKGAGEMASGIAVRLCRAGFRQILFLETKQPLAVRRPVSFCEAVYDGRQKVEGIEAVRLDDPKNLESVWQDGRLAVAVDPQWDLLWHLQPRVSIDAIIAKKNLGTMMREAPVVIALGPGFTAGVDAHYVVETNRGHNLGRVFTTGQAEPNTGVPGAIAGFTSERVLRAPISGIVEALRKIGDVVKAGDVVCRVNGEDVPARLDGVVRGLIRDGSPVKQGLKLGDVDPRGNLEYCFTVSEKARALGGAVLEIICADLFQNS